VPSDEFFGSIEDPQVKAYVDAKKAELDAIYSVVVANVPKTLQGERADVRTKKTNLSTMICDAMTEVSGADFAITNGGGIRSSIEAGKVTMGDVIRVLPFNNIVTVAEVATAVILLLSLSKKIFSAVTGV